jgi:hypothetical protein
MFTVYLNVEMSNSVTLFVVSPSVVLPSVVMQNVVVPNLSLKYAF